MILPASYANGLAPRDGQPLYPELWRGCVGAWASCLGPTGLTLRDWSGLANHGTLTNMSASSDWVVRSGRYALDFDGSNDYVPTSRVPVTGTGQITISIWVLQSSDRTEDHAIKFGTATTANAIGIYKGLANEIEFGLHASSFARFTGWSAFIGKWTHLAGVLRQGYIGLYINGVLAAEQNTVAAYNIGTTFCHIGAAQSVLVPWVGQIDDVRVYGRVLSSNEITLLASRRGIAFELASRRRSALVAGFNRRRRLLVGAGS